MTEVEELKARIVELEKQLVETKAHRVAFALTQAIGERMIVAWMSIPGNRFIKQFWLYSPETEKMIQEGRAKNEWGIVKRVVPNMNKEGIYFKGLDRRFPWGNMKFDVHRGIIMEGFIDLTKEEFDLLAAEINNNDWQDFDDETWGK